MTKRKKPRSPSLRELREKLSKQADHPVIRELREKLSKLRSPDRIRTEREMLKKLPAFEQLATQAAHPVIRELREKLSRLADADAVAPKPKRSKGGRPPHLTEAQIKRGRRLVNDHPEWTFKKACAKLNELLGSNVSPSTLRRLIWNKRQ